MILIKAVLEDAEILFKWVNDKDVRENSIMTKSISWEEHLNWFNKKNNSNTSKIYIAKVKNINVGQIRFDFKNDEYFIDYSVDCLFRGKGYGYILINEGIKKIKEHNHHKVKIKAIVSAENLASINIFTKCNFVLNKKVVIENKLFFLYEY